MNIRFTDKDGKILRIVNGKIDPERYARKHNLEAGWRAEEMSPEESEIKTPREGIYHEDWDSPHQRIQKLKAEYADLKKKHEALIDIMEAELKLPLKAKLDQRLKGG